jgi:hypothetical protein
MRHFMADPDNPDRLLTIPQQVVNEITSASVSQRYGSAPLCAEHAEDMYETECFECDLLAYLKKRVAQSREWGFKQGERDMFRRCMEAVEQLKSEVSQDRVGGLWDALAALAALSPQPSDGGISPAPLAETQEDAS